MPYQLYYSSLYNALNSHDMLLSQLDSNSLIQLFQISFKAVTGK
jgi:hypothetical protein